MKAAVPASKKWKGAISSSGPTNEIRHQFLQFPLGPQEELFEILRARPLTLGQCIDWAALEQPFKGIDSNSSSTLSPCPFGTHINREYRLARSTDEDDTKDIPDGIPTFQEDPPSQPQPSHLPVHAAISLFKGDYLDKGGYL
ncbi:hypothetical protein GOBAR_AA36247 [Gossypium barbadense]|uniref:Uncharacterized protein n=1 Tax=Gossypium barbadense TaxID=3634 RepID=A0A2P5W068_GOSBA|nr:hypothetical protein GOBAR_AA36247 [Gossypium barbadense]